MAARVHRLSVASPARHNHKALPLVAFCAGKHIRVVNTDTLTVLETPPLVHSALVIGLAWCFDSSEAGGLLASVDSAKTLKLWRLSDWSLAASTVITKRAACLAFSACGSTLIIGDKVGDVRRYTVSTLIANGVGTPPVTASSSTKKEGEDEDEDGGSGELFLGHLSVVTDVALTSDGKYILTSDRDEHIRLSAYPKAYNIEGYCHGHTDFVTRLLLLSDTLLVSAGGDASVRLWSIPSCTRLSAVHAITGASLPVVEVIVPPEETDDHEDQQRHNPSATFGSQLASTIGVIPVVSALSLVPQSTVVNASHVAAVVDGRLSLFRVSEDKVELLQEDAGGLLGGDLKALTVAGDSKGRLWVTTCDGPLFLVFEWSAGEGKYVRMSDEHESLLTILSYEVDEEEDIETFDTALTVPLDQLRKRRQPAGEEGLDHWAPSAKRQRREDTK